jgi:prepilin-type N-terminal cleavage/methylation domain-containing protein
MGLMVPRRSGDHRGFTLIEVVVAAGIILVVVVATTNAVVTVGGASSRLRGADEAERYAAGRLEWLRSLPFWSPASGDAVVTLPATVFPHADGTRNTGGSFFSAQVRDDRPPGTFFTVTSAPVGTVTVAATFVVSTARGWRPIGVERLAGYDAAGRSLPAAALLVRTSVVWRQGSRRGVQAREAVLAAGPDGPCRLAAPDLAGDGGAP